MANTLNIAVLSTKTVTNVSTNIFTATFDMFDFSPSTSDATVEGPLSLVLDIFNDRTFDMFVSLQIQRLDGIVNVGDRKHIGYVIAGQRQVITSASVPQLGRLDGTIVKVVVTLYGLYEFGPQTGVNTTVSIRMAPITGLYAPQPYIGADEASINPGHHRSANPSIVALPAVLTTVTLYTLPINANMFFRFAIREITVVLPSTVYIADLTARITITDKEIGTTSILAGMSKQGEYVRYVLAGGMILATPSVASPNPLVQVAIFNSNAALTYTCEATIDGDIIF